MASQEQSPKGREIPAIRRVVVNDPSQMPSIYSETPGGTLFSTTPGGTRIVYDRSFLLKLRNSPLAQTPPKMAVIPGVTLDSGSAKSAAKEFDKEIMKTDLKEESKLGHDDNPQFEMDI